MAIVVTSDAPSGDPERDQMMRERLNVVNDPPPGALARVAGYHEGGWRIMSVWESEEAFDAFRRERLEPMLQEVGAQVPEFKIWPVESVVIQPSRR